MSTNRIVIIGALLVCLAAPAYGTGPDRTPSERLIEAYGGREKLQSIHQVELEWVGYFHGRFQSRTAGAPYDRLPTRRFYAVDFQSRQGVGEWISTWPGGLNMAGRDIYSTGGTYTLNTVDKSFTVGGMAEAHGIQSLFDAVAYRQPWVFVRSLIGRPSVDLRDGPDRDFEGKSYATLSQNDGKTTLFVDKQTGLIHAISNAAETSMMGVNSTSLRIFDQYVRHRGVPINRRAIIFEDGMVVQDHSLASIDVNRPVPSQYLAVPKNYRRAETGAGGYTDDTGVEALKIADSVWLAGTADTRILYVDTGQYWVATEAGGMPSMAREAYEKMKPHMGRKPLRYIVPTHHHDDHAIAVKFYVSIGATILTTRDKEAELRRLLARSVDGLDPQSDAKFEFVEGPTFSRRSGGAEYRGLIYENGPHAENMVVAYVPSAKALFQADIWIDYGGQMPGQGGGFAVRHFDAWLKELQAHKAVGPIEHYLSVHGTRMTPRQYDRLLAQPRTVTVLPSNQEWDMDKWYQRYGLSDDTVADPRRDHVLHGDAP